MALSCPFKEGRLFVVKMMMKVDKFGKHGMQIGLSDQHNAFKVPDLFFYV